GFQVFRWAVRDSNPRSLRQLIYSQLHLATLVTAQDEKHPSDTASTLPTPHTPEQGQLSLFPFRNATTVATTSLRCVVICTQGSIRYAERADEGTQNPLCSSQEMQSPE